MIGKLRKVFSNLLKMINKKNFQQKIAITQGRHLRIIKKKIQIFPEKDWKKELTLFKYTKLNYIEWVVSDDNFKSNPLTKKQGHKIINKYLKKNKIKCRSVDLDFIARKNIFKFSKIEIVEFFQKIKIIFNNANKIGIKYLIFPFLENSSPNSKYKLNELIKLLNEIHEKLPSKLLILIETDLSPKKLLRFIKKMNQKIFINYDLGNSASKNFDFNEEKKYFKFVKNIHLKDRVKNGSTVRFGEGNANFKELFKFLLKNKFNCNFTLQPARSKCNKDIKEILINLKYIKQLLLRL